MAPSKDNPASEMNPCVVDTIKTGKNVPLNDPPTAGGNRWGSTQPTVLHEVLHTFLGSHGQGTADDGIMGDDADWQTYENIKLTNEQLKVIQKRYEAAP